MKTKKRQTKSEETTNNMTMVKTGYARVAILLLAVNLCLTAYAFARLNEYTDARISAAEGEQQPIEEVKNSQ